MPGRKRETGSQEVSKEDWGVKRHLIYAMCCTLIILVNLQILRQLVTFSLKHEFASMIPFMPFMSAALIYRSRERIYEQIQDSPWIGGIFLLAGAGLTIWAGNNLSIKAAGILCLIFGAFLISYGRVVFQRALFPLLMLLFMIPIPQDLIQIIISFLQRGSAEVAAILFKITGTPYFRNDLVFSLPKVSIEIAAQCSGIRSSLALLLSCLLAGHLILRSPWRKLIFVVIAIIMAMVKNAIRIVTLSLLAIHIDWGYLDGDLHNKGGVFFFVTTLLMLWPVLWFLRKTEKTPQIPPINTK
jgi:exosortase